MSITAFQRGNLRSLAELSRQPQTTSTRCRIRAKNDVEAIERWLDEYFEKPATYRTYKKEAERFLVWCVNAQKTNFSSLDREHVEAYIEFLKNPSPKEVWCGPRRKKKGVASETTWYPFAGPLGESAIKLALASLNSLMSYLVDARYVDANPFALIRRKSRFKKSAEEQSIRIQERIVEDHEWSAIIDVIESSPESDDIARFKKERLRFLFSALFFLGLRIDELARALWAHLKKINGRYWFFVRGKGDSWGKVPVNSGLLQAIMRYRHQMGMAPLPESEEHMPLIFSLRKKDRALTVRQMSNLVKEVATLAAKKFDPASISHKKLLRFSPHWLRHLSASRQDLAGISFTNIKSNLRHQNEQTTRLYVHAHDDHRHQQMENLKLQDHG
ncbi:MAG TPA: site-specific integrase [Myxococcota bacterium]|nr:site-specific integrase [Myxococcota bacterium]